MRLREVSALSLILMIGCAGRTWKAREPEQEEGVEEMELIGGLSERAAFDLGCTDELHFQKFDAHTVGVTGCGKRGTYVQTCRGWGGDECTWILNGSIESTRSVPPPRPAPEPEPAPAPAPSSPDQP